MARVAPAVLLVGLVLLGCGPRTPSVPAPDGDPSGPTPLHPTLNPGPAFVLEPLESFVLPPVQTSFQTYELIIPQSALDLFEADPFAPEQPATFVHDGQRLPVDVRLRGASARAFPKKSWNVDFNDLRFEGREELNLVSEYPDSTMMVEKLAWDMLEAMRVPAPRSKYVRLVVNGQYQGVFLDIEEVDTKFTRARRFPDPAPNIYRCGFWNCEMKPGTSPWQGDWQKKSNKAEPRDDLDALVQLINFTPEPEFAWKLEQTLELEGFLRMMAVEVLVSMNLIEDSEGYYVHDRVTGRWSYVPWDFNNADATFWPGYPVPMDAIVDHPLFPFTLQNPYLQHMYELRGAFIDGYEPAFCNLRTRILNNPVLRARLLATLEKAWKELLDPAVLTPWIEQTHAALAPHMKDDPWVDPAQFAFGREFLTDYANRRFAFVRDGMAAWKARRPGLVIEQFDPAGGSIVLRNRSEAPVSTSGLVLTPSLRRSLVPPNVPARDLAPGESVSFSQAELGLSFGSRGEIGLFDGRTVSGVIDLLFYGELSPGQRYVRADDPEGTWQIR